MRTLKAFHANQGLLLAGALAYYMLLSIIPLLTFFLLILSHLVDEAALMGTLSRYIGLAIPGESDAILSQIRNPRFRFKRRLRTLVSNLRSCLAR